MILLLLLGTGCENIRVIDSYCLWAGPITITTWELDNISSDTLRQIDNNNQIYESKCINNK